MTADQLFSACNPVAMLGWLLLIVLPGKRWPSALVSGVLIPLLLAIVYFALIVTHFGGSQGGFSTLPAVAQLFGNRWLLLAGWVHYLAFDLFIGSWEVREAQRVGLSHWLVIPCLVLTFLFGPIGLLLFLAIRSIKTGRRLALVQ